MKQLLLLTLVLLSGLAEAQIFWPEQAGEELSTEPWSGANSAIIDLNNDGVDDVVINEDGFSFDFISVNGVFAGYGQFYDMSFGDFNEDGFLDIVGNYNYSKSSILLSDDTKTFGDADFYAQVDVNSISTSLLTVGDFNNDGNLDVLTYVNTGINQFSLSLGDGLGGFTHTNLGNPDSWVVGQAWAIDALDMNGDGNLDIVSSGKKTTASPNTYGITISLGNGDGTFTFTSDYYSSATYYGGSGGDQTHIVDIDGDGADDIVFENSSGGEISVLYNNGTSAPTESGTGFKGEPRILDFNEDLSPDIAFFTNDAGRYHYNIIINDGTGNFSSGPSFTNAYIGSNFMAGDVDGDGSDDLVYYDSDVTNTVISHFDPSYKMYKGMFPATSLRTETYQDLILTDLDFDGYSDMVVSFSDSIAVYFSKDNIWQYDASVYSITSASPGPIVSVDLLGDGYPEIIVGSSAKVEVFDNANGSALTLGDEFVTNAILDIASGDMNGDGSPDVVALTSTDILIFLNDGSGNLGNPIGYASPGLKHIALGDINDDGKLDVVSSTSTRIYLNLGDGAGAITVNTSNYRDGREAISIGDFNSDGIDDILTQTYSSNWYYLTAISGESGKLISEMTATTSGSANYSKKKLTVADFDFDGIPDVVTDTRYNKEIIVSRGAGDGSFVAEDPYILDINNNSGTDGLFAVGDFDADLAQDIIYVANNMAYSLLNGIDQAAEPTIQASNVTLTDITSTSITVNWDRGNGDFVYVLASKDGFDPLVLEAALTNYDRTPSYGGYTLVASSAGTSAVISNLDVNTEYTFAVFEVAGGALIERSYLTSGVPTNVGTTLVGDQTISFDYTADVDFTYDAYEIAGLNLSVNSGLEMFLEVVSGPATITADTMVQLTGLGAVTLRASQPGNADWNAAPPVDQTFNVVQATQTITFALPATSIIGYEPLELPVHSSAGLPISYVIDAGAGSLITDADTTWYVWGAEGSVTITASQAGNTEVAAASSVQQITDVVKRTQSISFTMAATTYIAYENLQLPIYSSDGEPISYTIDSGIGALLTDGDTTWYEWAGEGAVTITASQAGNAEVSAAVPVVRATNISKQDQTITWNKSRVTQNSSKPLIFLEGQSIQMTLDTLELNAVSSSGLPVTYIIFTGPGYLEGIDQDSRNYIYSGVGDVTITASASGDAVYNSTFPSNVNFTIIKGDQTISYNAQIGEAGLNNYAYDPNIWVKINGTSTAGLDITYEKTGGNGVATIVGDSVNVTTIGGVGIQLSQPGDDNWNPAVEKFVNWNVFKANQIITFDDIYENMVVKDSVIVLEASNDSGREITYAISRNPSGSDVSIEGNTLIVNGTSKSGAIKIRAYSQLDENYNPSTEVFVDFCLLAATPSITVSGLGTPAVTLTSSNSWDYAEWEKDGSEFSSFAGNFQPTITSQSEVGTYKVRARSYDLECPVSDWSDEVSLLITGLDELANQVGIYPNPAEYNVFVNLPIDVNTDIDVYATDMNGRTVALSYGLQSSRQLSIDVSQLRKGNYLLHFKTGDQVFYNKLNKK